MPITHAAFVRSTVTSEEAAEVSAVEALVAGLLVKLREQDRDINRAHVVGAQSMVMQQIVGSTLLDIGFSEEVVLTPQDGIVTRARPDFVRELATGRGVMAEVERGGTVNNNHDLKDLWKAHIAVDIQHLVLVVPNLNWKTDGSGREKPFPRVCQRVGAFFGDPRREVDILSAHVIGYGHQSAQEAAIELQLRDLS